MKPPANPLQQTVNSRQLFHEHFKLRSDIGFGNFLIDIALEVRNPFKPWEPRRWKKEFLAALLVFSLAAAWIFYWNVLS